jgi:hypothetical protein
MRTILSTILLALPAHAGDTYTWGSAFYPSTIVLGPTEAPGAVAQVTFDNRTVHRDEDVTFVLDLGDLAVTVDASVGRGLTPDTFRVTPPPGYFAVPESLDVAEDDVGVIVILPFLGY